MSTVPIAKVLLKRPIFLIKIIRHLIKGAIARLFYGFIDIDRKRYPSIVFVSVTRKCNLNCRMCFIKDNDDPEELAIEDYKNLIKEVKKYKPIIQLSGGEPFLYKNIIELIEFVKSNGLSCMLTTNGTFLKDFAPDIVRLKVDRIAISLDGIGKVHDEIRGLNGLFEQVIDSVRYLIGHREKIRANYPIISLQTAICDRNYFHLSEIAKIFENIDVDFLVFFHFWYSTKEQAHMARSVVDKDIKIVNTSKDEIRKNIVTEVLKKEIEIIKNNYKKYPIIFFPDLSYAELDSYYKDPFTVVKQNKCIYPFINARVLPNGDVIPCVLNLGIEYAYGNIKKDRLLNIWNNDKAKKFRQTLKKSGGMLPICNRCSNLFLQ